MARVVLTALVILCVALPAFSAEKEAANNEAPISDDQVLTPNVKRNKVKVGKIDTEDFEVGAYGGIYSIEDFGSNLVVGVKLAYHFSESLFLMASAGQTKGDQTAIEKLLGTDFLTEDERKLTYYNVLIGWNVLPGEAFIGSNWAFATAFYFVAGAGNTNFGGEDRFTITAGAGYQFFATDWLSIQMDFRDHIFDQDLLGDDKSTHNLELTAGFSIFF